MTQDQSPATTVGALTGNVSEQHAPETDLQPSPVCPHCGYVERDAWEWNFGPGLEGSTEQECGSCGGEFTCEREVSIYYSTKTLGATA